MLSILSTVSGMDINVKLSNINNVETKFRLKDHFFNTSLYYDNSDALLNGLQFQNSQEKNSIKCFNFYRVSHPIMQRGFLDCF